MDTLSLQEACLIDLLRTAAESQTGIDPLSVVKELREMRFRLEELEGIEAEDFMIRPYSARERARLIAVAST